MNRLGWLNLLLAILLLVLAAVHLAIPSDPEKRNFQYFPNLVNSVAHEAQAPVPVFEDGRKIDLRPPVGSVARGYMPQRYEATPEDAIRAGLDLKNPVLADDVAALERGAFVFTTFCATCHGPGMQGDGTVTKKGVPPPPSLFLQHALDLKDGQIWHIITYGQANMAGYASQVDRDDRWKVVSWIRQEQAAEVQKLLARATTQVDDETAQATTQVDGVIDGEAAVEAEAESREESES
jgi:mono/diheme cytochrome c family protein